MFWKKRKVETDEITEAIDNRKNKTYMRRAKRIFDEFEYAFLKRVKYRLNDTNLNNLIIVILDIDRKRVDWEDDYASTHLFTSEVFEMVDGFIRNFCKSYGFQLIFDEMTDGNKRYKVNVYSE